MSTNVDPQLRHDRVLLDLIADKWTMLVLGALCDRDKRARFNALKRQVAGISQKSLTQCLRRLERNGLVQRRIIAAAPLGIEYSFTPLGATLDAPIRALFAWTTEYGNAVRTEQSHYDARMVSDDDAPGVIIGLTPGPVHGAP